MVKDPSAVRYQEAMLRESDSRFVIDRIRGLDSEHGIALNHCRLVHADFDPGRRVWNIGLRDELDGREHVVRARAIVNAAGSSLTREADAVVLLQAGTEISVAATKSYTSQALVTLRSWADTVLRMDATDPASDVSTSVSGTGANLIGFLYNRRSL